jgi:hypothetical protein
MRIEFTCIRCHERHIVLRSETELNVSHTKAIVNLNEVVMIGYGTAKKNDLTGAVGSVAEKDFNNCIISSPDQLIQGKVSARHSLDRCIERCIGHSHIWLNVCIRSCDNK